ncbi:MAG TPA: tetratricopeptide repeat protein [Pyrinomonadaceae bacterium]|jgi:tetratricopeptide (TPR) repeat protein
MLSRFHSHARILSLLSLALLCASVTFAQAQTSADFGSAEDDPIKLFERGQDEHEHGNLQRAVEFYDQAIKLKPEFPEAEFQRAAVLVSLNRLPEAERGFRRALELNSRWALPSAALGALLVRLDRFQEAEPFLAGALRLDAKNEVALLALTDLRLRARAAREALQQLLLQLQRVTAETDAPASLWAARGSVERALDDKNSALASLDRALTLEPRHLAARMERAEMRAGAGNYEGALADATEARRSGKAPAQTSLLLARIYAQAGKTDEALRTLDALDEGSKRLPEVAALRSTLARDCTKASAEDRAAFEQLLKQDGRNASLLACLGASYRTDDPARALDYYRGAAQIEPGNVNYATGYAAALVQARRFGEAAVILRRVLAVEPDSLTAHTNLATALYELKQFPEALAEFGWLVERKPDLAVAYYFIATAHDFLGEYTEALAAYEAFLKRADAQTNQLEIDKVNLRLPLLRNQVKRGEGVKKKKNGQ